SDTIVAPATAPGRGGVGVVRLSGPGVAAIAARMLPRGLPEPRRATLTTFRDAAGEAIDSGLALHFPAPHSYTGEAVLELHGHGGPAVLAALVERAVELGARRAEPGEFTRRAYLHDKLDLAQAEAVADLIDAGSRAAARAAVRSLQGAFSDEVHGLVAGLIDLRVWVEAAIDFPEEDIDFLADPALAARVEALRGRFDAVTRAARQGRVLRDGLTVVIAGRPNAGKSSLLNALVGHEAAIVTDLPGTTRDVVREQLELDGLPLQVLDTAGLLVAGEGPADVVEAEGIRRTRAEIARADRVLFVVDAAADPAATAYAAERATLPEGVPVTLVMNKVDLVTDAAHREAGSADAVLRVSAHSGAGLADLRAHLQAAVGYSPGDTGALSARARHLDALARARAHLETACGLLADKRGELVAEELRLAQRALGEITGEFSSDDLLGRIFGSFCIGK
ncbi:MAG: tRNA uridine-5-carboxymethylaminomethyl(34) synthesis GTPase MnmE, partial [Gammaproteobacteria bacterium]